MSTASELLLNEILYGICLHIKQLWASQVKSDLIYKPRYLASSKIPMENALSWFESYLKDDNLLLIMVY